MELLLGAAVYAYLLTRLVSTARTEHELAKKGTVPPRMQAKYGADAAGRVAGYGFFDFLGEAWRDYWPRRTEALIAARNARAEAGQPAVPMRERIAAGWGKLVNPVGTSRPEPAPMVTPPVVEPVPLRVETGDVEPGTVRFVDGGGREVWTGTGWEPLVIPPAPDALRPQTPKTVGPGVEPPTSPDAEPGTAAGGRRTPLSRQSSNPCGWCDKPATHYQVDAELPICGECADRLERSGAWEGKPKPCARCGTEATATHYRTMLPICRACSERLENTTSPVPPFYRSGKAGPGGAAQTDVSQQANGGTRMTAATGEAVNYETTVAELKALEQEQQTHLDACVAALDYIEGAKAQIDAMQTSYRTSAAAATSMHEHLAARNLDAITLVHTGTTADAMPASAVDAWLAQLEEIETTAKERRDAAETALASTQAALEHVTTEWGEENAKVAKNLGGDASWLGSTAA